MFNRRFFLMDSAGGGEDGGASGSGSGQAGGAGGEGALSVKPDDARTFLSTYGHSPETLKSMPDPDVVKLAAPIYENHTKALSGATAAAVEKAKGEWGKTVPENWRELAAAGDEKKLEQLKRFTSYEAYNKAFFDAQETIRSGSHKKTDAFPDKGTPEQQAEWRKAQGIPEKPEGYDLNLGDGLVIGEADKPRVDAFLKHAHATNMTPEAVKSNLAFYFKEQQQLVKDMETERAQALADTKKTLEQKWGGDYERNRNAFLSVLDGKISGKSETKQRIINAFDTNPEFAEMLASMALDINPSFTGTGPSGDMPQAVADELGGIRKLMGDHNSDYWKGPKAADMQKRYRELSDWEERNKQKGK